jgi:glycosyltransferase involved in cell wall biosynthesis
MLTVAIPALNEERNLAQTLQAVLGAAAKAGAELEILVVDDGSTDRTAEVARKHAGVRVLSNPRNLGLGASIRRAIAEAKGDRFMIVPGDNDLPEATLERLFRHAGAADVVMTYFLNEEIRGRMRYLVSEAFRLLYTTLFDLYVEYINGPAVYPVAKLRELPLRSRHFSIIAEMNVRLLRQGCSFAEIPAERQNGIQRSSVTLRNLADTTRVMLCLLVDVYLRERGRYARRPVRVRA